MAFFPNLSFIGQALGEALIWIGSDFHIVAAKTYHVALHVTDQATPPLKTENTGQRKKSSKREGTTLINMCFESNRGYLYHPNIQLVN